MYSNCVETISSYHSDNYVFYPPFQQNPDNMTIGERLKCYVKFGWLEGIKQLFSLYGIRRLQNEWNSMCPSYASPVLEASEFGFELIVEYLIDNGFNVNEWTDRGSHCIHLAAYRGHCETIKLLIDKYKIDSNLQTESGCTPLILASRNGHLGAVDTLISKYNVKLEIRDSTGSTALHRACGWDHPMVAQYLLTNTNINIDIKKSTDGQTPLMMAAYYNRCDCIETLLKFGANIEVA